MHAINEEEPETFSEPGLFLIKPDKTLYAAAIQTMPFTRPNLSELLQSLKYLKQKGYPARGEAESSLSFWPVLCLLFNQIQHCNHTNSEQ